MSFKVEINGLRALAVGGVLLSHYKITTFSGGFAGVDVFFVISGYLITRNLLRDIDSGTFNFRTFYSRRARRLLPALYATLIASFVVAALLFSPERLAEFSVSLMAAVLSASNILFWTQQGYFDTASDLKPLLHTWSLGVEEQFYLLWPVLLLLGARMRVPVLFTLSALFAASFASNVFWRDQTSTIFFLLPFRVFEFAIGGFAVLLEQRFRPGKNSKELLSIAGCAMILAAFLTFTEQTHFPYFPALLPCLGAAFVILAGSTKLTGVILESRVANWLGERSYSLYLLHWPPIVFWYYLKLKPLTPLENLLLFIGTLLLAEMMYRYIEQPLRWRDGRASFPTRHINRYTVAAASLLLAIGFSATNGWMWRLGDRSSVAFQTDAITQTGSIYGGAECGDVCETRPGEPVANIVIGDSHAQQYFLGFKKAFPNVNTRFYHASSCPIFSSDFTRDFFDYPDPALYDRNCRAARKMAFEAIRSTSANVFISQFWVNFPLVSESTGEKKVAASIKEAMVAAAQEIGLLQREYDLPRLFVIGSVPAVGRNLLSSTDCSTRPYLSSRNDCKRSLRTVAPHRTGEEVNGTLSKSLPPSVTFLDPFDALCDVTHCYMQVKGMPAYSDATHLTRWSSEEVVQAFAKTLRTVQ